MSSSVQAAKRGFFGADLFGVVGASKDQSKIGNKVLRWYQDHGLRVTPVHPKEAEIEGLSTVASVKELPEASKTSLSVITPPKVSLGVVKSALEELGVVGVWLQPGAEDDEVRSFVASLPEAQRNKVVLGGPCILVEGRSLAQAQGRL